MGEGKFSFPRCFERGGFRSRGASPFRNWERFVYKDALTVDI